MEGKLVKFVLLFHGLYYWTMALWAILNMESFFRVIGVSGDPFKTQVNAGFLLIFGLLFIWSSLKDEMQRLSAILAIAAAFAVIIPEIIYLPSKGFNLFWLDLLEEIIVAGLLGWVIFNQRKPQKAKAAV